MPLLDRAQGALNRIKKAEAARSGVEAAHALGELRNALSQRHDSLPGILLQARVLRDNKVPVSGLLDMKSHKERIEGVASRFRESPVAATLRAGQRWTGLMSALDSLGKTARDSLLGDWKNYFDNKLFAGLPPGAMRTRLALTPKNEKALSAYASLFGKFTTYQGRIPISQAEFDEIRSCSTELGKITFDENVPDEVAKFFAATVSGASLELLTPAVVEWLRKNQLLEKYVVRARLD